MKAYLDCYPCLFTQVLNAARMHTADEQLIRSILDRACQLLPTLPLDATPPVFGREVYRLVSEMTGVRDPYKETKELCTRLALDLYPGLKKRIRSSDDPLLTAIRLAIAGNVIDFGTTRTFDIREDVKTVLNQDFAVNDYSEFRQALGTAKNVLFIGDNAGETVFDRMLIEELGKTVIYVVREKPIINDAVREDAVEAGIDKVAEILSSGCDAPGNILELCSEEFIEVYRSADIIISKGQGNYEALSEEDRPIFFLLKAKCQVIARDIGVEQGSIILMKR